MKTTRIGIFLVFPLYLLGIASVQAQYFGQNKVKYEKFDFEVLESPHFEFYHYLQNEPLLKEISQNTEHWHDLHQAVLLDTLDQKNPIVFYNDHADFQQTNTISGNISVGVGGVTEALKNRVIMPLTLSKQQTNHVLGHELVHAFQFNMILNGDSTSIRNLGNLPLWMIEGMAEYLSIGRVDAHTAMWMRDAVLQDDVPSIQELNSGRYFPYRYGQAFWAFLTGVYSDQVIRPFFMESAKYGLEEASKRVLNTSLDQLSARWQKTLTQYYQGHMKRNKEQMIGKALLSGKNAGGMNLSPVLSPNGKYVVFLSEKNLFSLDLFLADTRSGKVIRQIASTLKDGRIDDFNYLESSGAWSPKSKQFAFVVVSKGGNQLLIKDISNGKTVRKMKFPNLSAFSHPTWSPDGKHIVVSGLVQGQTDLYSIELKSGKVTQLTNDAYSELQAQWSTDGRQLVYATDQWSQINGPTHGKWTFNLATYDWATGQQKVLDVFNGADNLNPVFDTDNNIIFVSNRDGFRNIYKYNTRDQRVFQLTDFLTGVSGITHYAPAISIDRKRNRLAYSHYHNKLYTVYQAKPEQLLKREVPSDSINFAAATLPVDGIHPLDVVNTNINRFHQLNDLPEAAFKDKKYRPQFRLDYIGGNAGVGVSTGNNSFGSNTALAGGVDFLFSDILGDNQLYAGVSLNGDLLDLSGQISYINRKNKIAWGASLSHFTFRTGFNNRPVPDF
ncbi:MAG: basic secretory protein-like protein, partial [Bacteroidota bacterium]